jgi:4-methyl-5(b-hydroxyethyl)-thiazole monophosphate biosynthesis
MGLLKDKTAVCYPGMEDMLFCKTLSKEPVVQDGNIITAQGMGVSYEFGLKITEYLYGAEKASLLKKSTCGR